MIETKTKINDNIYCPKYISAQKALDELATYILGEDYCIVDPLGVEQCNYIILEDIKKKYDKNKNIFTKIINLFK